MGLGEVESNDSEAWVTLTTNDVYAVGALVLGRSLIRSGTTRKLVVMITNEVSPSMREQLALVFDRVENVSLLDSKDVGNLALLERPELGVTFTKLQCWRLIQYKKCVFLDADTLVMRNSDDLFDREELSAAPDAGWPDCFNSGVFVFRPNLETFKALMVHAQTEGSFDGGDQGLLNTFFSDWATKDITKHLSFLYNMCATATYTYIPAYKKFGKNVRIIHFIGQSKPWHMQWDEEGSLVPRTHEEHTLDHVAHWWTIFREDIQPKIPEGWRFFSPKKSEVGPRPSYYLPENTGVGMSPGQYGQSERGRWEEGRPDYVGGASFDNILMRIEKTMREDPDGKH